MLDRVLSWKRCSFLLFPVQLARTKGHLSWQDIGTGSMQLAIAKRNNLNIKRAVHIVVQWSTRLTINVVKRLPENVVQRWSWTKPILREVHRRSWTVPLYQRVGISWTLWRARAKQQGLILAAFQVHQEGRFKGCNDIAREIHESMPKYANYCSVQIQNEIIETRLK